MKSEHGRGIAHSSGCGRRPGREHPADAQDTVTVSTDKLAALLLRGPSWRSPYLSAPSSPPPFPNGRKGTDPSSQEAPSPTLSSLLSSSEPSHRSPVIFLPLHKAILLNISKKYSLTPSLFIYKNQLSTLLLCSIWILEQPGLYLAEIPLLSPQIPAQPQLQGLGGGGGLGGCRVAPRGMRASFACYLAISSKYRLG